MENSDAVKKYVRKAGTTVIAMQLRLDFDGFTYRKWGGEQRCKAGDWLVGASPDDVYTVDDEVFRSTYEPVPGMRGHFQKTKPVWARVASEDGTVKTLEGTTDYAEGDFIVANDPEFSDVWAMSADDFRARYEPADS